MIDLAEIRETLEGVDDNYAVINVAMAIMTTAKQDLEAARAEIAAWRPIVIAALDGHCTGDWSECKKNAARLQNRFLP